MAMNRLRQRKEELLLRQWADHAMFGHQRNQLGAPGQFDQRGVTPHAIDPARFVGDGNG